MQSARTSAVVQGRVVADKGAASLPTQGQQPPGLQAAAYGRSRQADVGGGLASSSAAATVSPERGDLGLLEMSCRDGALPPSARLGFVKKVYGILGAMLLVTFGIATPFIFATDATLDWFGQHLWVLWMVLAILLAQYIFHLCMTIQQCCGGDSLLKGYLSMMRTVPFNYIYLALFAVCFGLCVGFVCAAYTAQSVLLIFALTVVLIVALTVFAVRTQADFTGCGAYVMVLILGLLFLLLLGIFLRRVSIYHKVISAVGATLFGLIIVHDTQQIFGSASEHLGGGKRQFEYTLDMYAYAAWSLYLDFISFFIHLLELLGARRS